MREEKKIQGQLKAMWFAAGTAAFMACLERAVLVSFVEQWRVVVFIALNLLLLAILFTSPASSNEPTSPEFNEIIEFKVEGKIKRKTCTRRASMMSAADDPDHDYDDDDDGEDCGGGGGSRRLNKLLKCRSKREDEHKDEADELSNEELNERVEAFITMFRQHLVSDAKGKSCRVHSSASIKRSAIYNSHSGRN